MCVGSRQGLMSGKLVGGPTQENGVQAVIAWLERNAPG